MKGRGIIQRGAKWRAGNGDSIKIYGNNWLPTATPRGVHSPLLQDFQNATVSSLINHQTRTWDLAILSTALSPTEADLVQKITISSGQPEDILFWPFIQSGIYSVKSGYYFLKSETRSTVTQTQASPDHPKPPWNRIWNLHLPNKIKIFYGEQPVMHCPQVQNWFGNASSMIQSALSAQVTVRMSYTLCGPVRDRHKSGKKIRNGASGKPRGIRILYSFSAPY